MSSVSMWPLIHPEWQKQPPSFSLFISSKLLLLSSLFHTLSCLPYIHVSPSACPEKTSSPTCRVRCGWCWGWRWKLLSSWKRSLIAWTLCWSAAAPWLMLSACCAGTNTAHFYHRMSYFGVEPDHTSCLLPLRKISFSGSSSEFLMFRSCLF